MRTALLTLAVLSTALGAFAHDGIKVTDPWVREPNPARPVTAAFMTIENTTDETVTLVGASSESAEVVEVHEMKTVDGVMRMRMLEKLEIAPRSSVKLEPGGLHLMMIGLTGKLAEGDMSKIVLEFDGAKTITVDAPVKSAEAHH